MFRVLSSAENPSVAGDHLVGQVFLSSATDHELVIQITADDPTALGVPNAIIPAGQSSAAFEMTGLTVGAHVTLTATASGMLPALAYVDVTAPATG